MSVTGFSVQHDPEVQAYRKIRAAYLEEKAAKKREEKLQLRQIKEVRRAYLQNSNESFLPPTSQSPSILSVRLCRLADFPPFHMQAKRTEHVFENRPFIVARAEPGQLVVDGEGGGIRREVDGLGQQRF
ncbi:hypothetical protein PV08_04397 [Exophiala spinifera]|uniref:Uncharacterized protein n=1 Tax=Exophiala spinifera TaxID=91928 RepID=A0A0D1YPR3_9EURO|nr:uncharacterized protein PV08_04397 [Exophiala spinifera]KIW17206.1 hypothetical protein PV08_04397 [Exophiala spinifera]